MNQETTRQINAIEKIIDDLTGAFIFDRTEQGNDYWFEVIENLQKVMKELKEVQKWNTTKT